MTKTEYAKYLQGPEWRAKRLEAIELACNLCARCEIPRWLAEIAYDQDLHVHHKTYANLGNEELKDLEVLCRRCHDIETFGRSELRAPKEATCETCGDRHWNYRSARCYMCESVEEVYSNFGQLLRQQWPRITERIACYIESGAINRENFIDILDKHIQTFSEMSKMWDELYGNEEDEAIV